MHPARKFFYVCAGLFLLALSYHLGANNAHGQGATIASPSTSSGVVGRAFYAFYKDINGQGHSMLLAPVPGTEPVIATDATNGMSAMLANGDVYWWSDPGTSAGFWTLAGNLLGGATNVTRSTWGQLKAHNRDTQPQTPTPTTR